MDWAWTSTPGATTRARILQDLGGVSDIRLVERYTDVFELALREAMERAAQFNAGGVNKVLSRRQAAKAAHSEGRGLACLFKETYGAGDWNRTNDLRFTNCDNPRVSTGDQQLSDADGGEARQNFRDSATRRNQQSETKDSPAGDAVSHTKRGS